MGDPWGIECFRGGGEEAQYQANRQKNGQKISQMCEIGKKSDFYFYTENGLKWIRNRTKHL